MKYNSDYLLDSKMAEHKTQPMCFTSTIKLFIPQAFGTLTIEEGYMSFNLSFKACTGNFIDMLYGLHLKIMNSSAAFAKKMIVGAYISIKAFTAVLTINFDYLTLLCKQIQVAIYRSQADIRIDCPYFHIYHIGSRMLFGLHQIFPDGFPLAAILIDNQLIISYQ